MMDSAAAPLRGIAPLAVLAPPLFQPELVARAAELLLAGGGRRRD